MNTINAKTWRLVSLVYTARGPLVAKTNESIRKKETKNKSQLAQGPKSSDGQYRSS